MQLKCKNDQCYKERKSENAYGYCSNSCRKRHLEQKITWYCMICSGGFHPGNTTCRDDFCSEKCQGIHYD